MTTILRTDSRLLAPRFGTPRSPQRQTLGPAVGEVARLLGKPFMPWQQHVADVALEIDPDTGELAYDEIGLTVPRQSGKSTWVLAKAVHRASATKFFGPRQRMVYTAQTRNKAREKWEEDFVEDLKAARAFRGKFFTHLGNGNEHIRFTNRSRFGIESTTEKAGHGSTLDEAYIDEAFAQVDARLEQAFRPAMITRTNTQILWISTAGWEDASPYLQRKVTRGRESVQRDQRRGLAYFEWSAPEDADPEDPAVWRACMPALGFTITERAIRGELESADSMADFMRAYLNMWVPRHATITTVVDMDRWARLVDEDSKLAGRVCIAADIMLDRSWGSIGAAGTRPDGIGHVEVIDYQPGTGWMPARLAELQRKWKSGPVFIDAAGPMGGLIPELRAAKVEFKEVPTKEYAQACEGLYDDIVEDADPAAEVLGRLRHLDQPELNTALSIAKKTPHGEAWKWGRKNVTGDISPLVAVTLARLAFKTGATRKRSAPLDPDAHRRPDAGAVPHISQARW